MLNNLSNDHLHDENKEITTYFKKIKRFSLDGQS